MDRRIRIRVTGDDARDLGALHRWLSREDWFAQARDQRRLTVVYREDDGTERAPAADPSGPPMGGGITELVLVIAGAALSPVFDDLYRRAKVAARAWADNAGTADRRVEAQVRPDPDDAGDPGDAGSGDGQDGEPVDGGGGRHGSPA